MSPVTAQSTHFQLNDFCTVTIPRILQALYAICLSHISD